MNEFPGRLIVEIVDRASGGAIPELAVVVTILAPRKNNYVVHPRFTGVDGRVVFLREELDAEVRQYCHDWPMDFQARLDDCRAVQCDVPSMEEFARRTVAASRLAPFMDVPMLHPDFVSRLAESANRLYEPQAGKAVVIPGADEVKIRLALTHLSA